LSVRCGGAAGLEGGTVAYTTTRRSLKYEAKPRPPTTRAAAAVSGTSDTSMSKLLGCLRAEFCFERFDATDAGGQSMQNPLLTAALDSEVPRYKSDPKGAGEHPSYSHGFAVVAWA